MMVTAERLDRIESWALPLDEQHAELEVMIDAFAVRIEPVAPGGVPRVEAVVRNGRVPVVDVEVLDGRVAVQIRHPEAGGVFGWWTWGWRGERITLFLPRDVHARVMTGAGAVRVRDLDGGCDLDVSTGAGTVHADGVRGRVRLHTAAGAIEGHRLEGTLDVETAAGSIRLSVLGLDNGTHRVHSAAGTLRIDLAADMEVDVTGQTDSGSIKIEYPTKPGAAARLVASTAAGSIRVRALEPAPVAVIAERLNEVSGVGPYRRAAVPSVGAATSDPNGELQRVLEMVAEGKLSPVDAGDLLRAMGHRS